MTTTLEPLLGIESPTAELDVQVETLVPPSKPLIELGFLTVWELQSQLATLAFILLVAFVPLYGVVTVMLAWSLVAAVIYHHARQRGLPDLLSTQFAPPPIKRCAWQMWFKNTGVACVKTLAAGVQPFIFTRLICPLLVRPTASLRMRVARIMLLGVGFTLFGVTTSHHLLSRSGYAGAQALQLSLVAPFLNVPYRVLVSAMVVNAVFGLWSLLPA